MGEAMKVEAVEEGVQSPPASATPLKEEAEAEARGRLHELAGQLRRACTREGLVEYLRLRRRWG
jgi:hypothetical protein